ncbi:uncharacterized protein LOC143465709 isoform X2 [Clavelina lepadiformis]|uniref:uncharacterized protein LOC143465709 isoform X2 n=1 Tax=Clavelina lepadiformis TaxID=159417 RepID=UPI0040420FB9
MQNSDSVKVSIRVRPFIGRESGCESQWDVDTHKISLKKKDTRDRLRSYIYDRVFNHDEKTNDVYEEIAEPIVQSAMQGFNGTVFAYGQTSSGKTYTMFGSQTNPGIIPMAIHDIFTGIEKTPEREFLLRVSYLEIYNENLKDLLAKDFVTLTIREDEFKNVNVSGLTEHMVASPKDVQRYIARGEQTRQMAATNMNDRSSRSHAIFKMIIESRERVDMNRTRDGDETAVKVAQLNFVDLAGSERASQTGAEGQRLKEGCYINKSLMILGQVINQICKDSEAGGGSLFISFRDSKLTRILQPSLGGNALTAIICTVTLAVADETESTLRFASSAKQIKNKPQVNEVLSDAALLIRQKREINELRKRIKEMEKEKKSEQNEISCLQQNELEDKIQKLTRMLLVSSLPADHKQKQRIRRETWCPGAKGRPKGSALGYQVSPAQNSILEQTRQFSSIDCSRFLEELDQDEQSRIVLSPSQAPKRHFIDESTLNSSIAAKRIRFAEPVSTWKLLEEDLKHVQEELAATKDSLEAEKSVSKDLIEKVDKLNEINVEYHNKIDVLQKQLATKDEMEMKIRKLETDAKLQDEVIEQFLMEQTAEENEKEELKNKIHELSQQIVALEKRNIANSNAGYQLELQDLYGQLKDTGMEKRRLQQQVDEETERSRLLTSDVERLSLDITKMKEDAAQEVEEYKEKVSSLQSQLEASLSSTKSPDHTDKMENEILVLKSELTSRDDIISDLRKSLNQLEEELSEMALKREKHVTFQDQHQDMSASICQNMSETHKANSVKHSMIGERTHCLEEALEQCEFMATEKEDLKKEKDEIMFKYLEKDKYIDELKSNVDKMSAEINALEEQADFDRNEKKILFEEEKQNQEEIEKLKDNLQSLQNETEAMVEKHNEKILMLQRNINELKNDLKTSPENHQRTILFLKEDVANHEKSAKDAQDLLQESSRKLSEAKGEIIDLQNTIKSKDSELTKLQSDLESYMSLVEMYAESGAVKRCLERSTAENTASNYDDKDFNQSGNEESNLTESLKRDLEERTEELHSVQQTKDLLVSDFEKSRSQQERVIDDLKVELLETKAKLQKILLQTETHRCVHDILVQVSDNAEQDALQSQAEEHQKYEQALQIENSQLLKNATASHTSLEEARQKLITLENCVSDKDNIILKLERQTLHLMEENKKTETTCQEAQRFSEERDQKASQLETDLLLMKENMTGLESKVAEVEELEKKLSLSDENLTLMKSSIEEHERKLEQCQNTIEMTKDELNIASEELQLKTQCISDLEAKLTTKEIDLANSLKVITELEENVAKLRIQFENQMQELETHHSQDDTSSIQIREELYQKNEKICQLQSNLDRLRNQHQSSIDEANRLQEEVFKFQDKAAKLEKSLLEKADLNEKQSILLEEMKTKNLQLEETLSQNHSASNNIKKIAEECDTLKSKHAEQKFQDSESKLHDCSEKLKKTDDIISVPQPTDELETLIQANAKLENELLEKESQLRAALLEVEKEKSAICQLQAKVENLEQSELSKQAQQMQLLQNQDHLSEVEQNFVTLYSEFNEISGKHSALVEEVNVGKIQRDQLMEEMAEKDVLITNLDAKTKSLECDLTDVLNNAEREQVKCRELEDQVKTIRSHILDLENTYEESRIKAAESEMKLTDLNSLLRSKEEEILSLTSNLNKLQNTQEFESKDFQTSSQVQSLATELEKHKETINSLEKEIEEKEKKVAALILQKNEELKQLETELQSLRESSAELQIEADAKAGEFEDMLLQKSQEVEEKSMETSIYIQSLEAEIGQHKETISCLEKSIQETKDLLKEASTIFTSQKEEAVKILQTELQTSMEKVSQLEKEVELKNTKMESILIEKNQEIQAKNAENFTRIQTLEAEKEKYKQDIGHLEETVQKNEDVLQKKTSAVMKLSSLLSDTEQELDAIKQNISTSLAKEDHSNCQKEISELQEEIDLLQLEKRRKLKEFEHIQDALRQKEEDVEAVCEELKQIKMSAQATKNEVEKLTGILQEQTDLASQAEDEKEHLYVKMSGLEKILSDKEDQLEQMKQDTEMRLSVIEELQIKIKDLELCLTDHKADKMKLLEGKEHLSDVEKNFVTLYHDFNQLTKDYDHEKEQHIQELDLLQEKLVDFEEIKNRFSKEQELCLKLQDDLNRERSHPRQDTTVLLKLADKLRKQEDKITGLTCDYESARTKLELSASQINQLMQDLKEANENMNIEKVNHSSLAQQYNDLQAEQEKIVAEVEAGKVSIATLQTEKNALEVEIQSFEFKMKQLQLEKEEFRRDLEKAIQDSKDQIKQQVEERSTARMAVLEQELCKCNALVATLERKNKKLQDEQTQESATEGLKKLKEERDNLEYRLDKRTERVRELEKLLRQYDREMEEYKSTIAKLEKEDATEDLTKLKEEKNSLEQRLYKRTGRVRELERLLRQYDREIEEYKSTIAKLEKEDATEDLTKLNNENKSLEQQLSKRTERVRELEKLLRQYDREIDDYKSTIEKLGKEDATEDLTKLKEEKNNLEQRLHKRTGRVRELERLLRQYDREIEEYKSTIAKHENVQKQELTSSQTAGQENKVEKLQDELKITRATYEEKISSLQEKVKHSETRMFRLKEQLRVQTTQHNDSMAGQSKTRMATRSTISSGGFVQQTKLDILELDMAKLQREKKLIEKELAKYKDIEVKRRDENQALLDQNSRLKTHLRKLKQLPPKRVLQENNVDFIEEKSSLSVKDSLQEGQHSTSFEKPKENLDDACKSQ